MKRLTKKIGENYCSQNGDFYDLYNKLGKLEDLEEKISCPLDVVLEISENGFYDNYGYIPPYRIHRIDIFKKEIIYCDEDTNFFSVKLSDHRKTWWLKDDKSE